MSGQGRRLTDEQINRILQLLSETDLALCDIARRMACSYSVIVTINRKFGVRHYGGRRSVWILAGQTESDHE